MLILSKSWCLAGKSRISCVNILGATYISIRQLYLMPVSFKMKFDTVVAYSDRLAWFDRYLWMSVLGKSH